MPITPPKQGCCESNSCIGYLLRLASHAIHQKINRLLSKYDVTYPMFTVLNMVGTEPGLHSADCARLCILSPQAVNTIVTNLEKRKLLERHPHETHGKVLKLFLSKDGKQTLAKCSKLINAKVVDKILDPLTPKEEKIIRKWLFQCAMD